MDEINFNYSIEQMKRLIPVENAPQDLYLDSSNINTTFKSIEESLNMLYENTRHLENSINYCESLLNEKIVEYSDEINSTLKSIEDIRDLNKNMAFIEYPCILKDDLSEKKDRNGNSIKNMLLSNGNLTFNTNSSIDIPIDNIYKDSEYVSYYNNLKNNEDHYRAFYIENDIASKGIVESITVTLKEPSTINHIDLAPTNATIENFRLVYLNGVEEEFDYNNSNGMFPDAIVAQIKFNLVCKKYTVAEYSFDKTKLTDDVWTKIKELEYSYLSNSLSKIEIESLISRTYNDSVIYYSENFIASNLVVKKMYNYMFGIDTLKIKKITQSSDSCFISTPIDIKGLKQDEFIELHAVDYIDENATVEYSILDGEKEIHALPYGDKTVRNEKLFSSLPLRFDQDESLSYVIKRNGVVTDISLDDAKNQILSRFSIDYFPSIAYSYKPINSSVKVKAVIRKHTSETNSSFISSIKIRKHGGDSVWIDK